MPVIRASVYEPNTSEVNCNIYSYLSYVVLRVCNNYLTQYPWAACELYFRTTWQPVSSEMSLKDDAYESQTAGACGPIVKGIT